MYSSFQVSGFTVPRGVEVEETNHTKFPSGSTLSLCTALLSSVLSLSALHCTVLLYSSKRSFELSVVSFVCNKTIRTTEHQCRKPVIFHMRGLLVCAAQHSTAQYSTSRHCAYVTYYQSSNLVRCLYTCAARPPSFPVLLPPPVLLLPLTLSYTKQQGLHMVLLKNIITTFLPNGMYDRAYHVAAITSITSSAITIPTFCF